MKPRRVIMILLAAALWAHGADSPLDDLKERARLELKKPRELRLPIEALNQCRKILAPGTPTAELERALTALAEAEAGPEWAGLAEEALAQLRSQRDAEEKAWFEKIDAATKRAAGALPEAKHARDLDEPLRELAAYLRELAERPKPSMKVARAEERVRSVRRYLERWQDALLGLDLNDPVAADFHLQQLRSLPDDLADLFTRSEVMARHAALQSAVAQNPLAPAPAVAATPSVEAEAILRKMKTLADVREALPDLRERAARVGAGSWGEGKQTVLYLARICDVYANVAAGGMGLRSVNEAMKDNDLIHAPKELEWVRAELLSLVLPRLIDPLQPGAERAESCATYLKQEWQRAVEKEDWGRAAQIGWVVYYFQLQPSLPMPDLSAVRLLLAAENFQRAGEYVLAVHYYERALSTGAAIAGTPRVREKMEILRREHPQEYERGVKVSIEEKGR